MENEDGNKTKLKFLDNIVDFSRKIETLTEDLYQLLKSKDNKVLDPVKPIIEPRRGASAVVAFYNMYLDAAKTFKEVEAKLDATEIFKKGNDAALEIEDLDAVHVIELLGEFAAKIKDLENDSKIKIVSKMIEDSSKKLEKYLEVVIKVSLRALNRLPRVVDKLDVYSRFIIKHGNGDRYLKEYLEVFHSKLSFLGIENNKKALLQQTENLTGHFNMVKELNTRILGKRVAKNINKGIVQLLVLDLKAIVAKILAKIDKNQAPASIPFLIQLYARIRHREGSIVEEIEELFELKPEIIKLIFNCFIQFFGQLDLLEKPNSKLEAEELTVLLASILHEFSVNKEAKREWATKFGRSFGVSDTAELGSNFSEKCLLKITDLSSKLEIRERSIYVINNVHCFREYLDKFSGLSIKQLIYKHTETIIGLIKVEIGSKTPSEAYKYLLGDLAEVKKYSLPEEEQVYVSQSIRTMVEDRMAKKLIQGNPQLLIEAISNAYTGKAE